MSGECAAVVEGDGLTHCGGMVAKNSAKASAMGLADFWNIVWPKSSLEWRSRSTNWDCPGLPKSIRPPPGARMVASLDNWEM